MRVPASSPPTFAACLTPPGIGAIATVALRGPLAWTTARSLFHPAALRREDLPEDAADGLFWFGRLAGDVTDEVILSVKRRTPVPWVEVHCHGGQEVVRGLLEIFRTSGLRVCSWQQLERLTCTDRLRAEATVALSEALTVRAATILLHQQQGALGRGLARAVAVLQSGDNASASEQMAELVRWCRLGAHLTTPWRVVVAGAPNVGKSSLVNALAGYARCVVSPTPGTTRDVVCTPIAVDGWPVELADSAGLREEGEQLEQHGIGLAHQAIASADAVLWVLDGSTAPVWPQFVHPVVIPVINKCDLGSSWDAGRNLLRVSARTGAGLETLCQILATALVPEAPPVGAAVPFTALLCEAVSLAQAACDAGRLDLAEAALTPFSTGS